MTIANEELIERLNEALEEEHGSFIGYLAHAVSLLGPSQGGLKDQLRKMAGDEQRHAIQLHDRILALGGKPTTATTRATGTRRTRRILAADIARERKAINLYESILSNLSGEKGLLEQTLRQILADELAHLGTLEQMRKLDHKMMEHDSRQREG